MLRDRADALPGIHDANVSPLQLVCTLVIGHSLACFATVVYVQCLKSLGGAQLLRSLKAITRLRLQSELYSLTSPGVGRTVDLVSDLGNDV